MNGIETDYILDDWLTRYAIPTTKNAELDKSNKIVGPNLSGEMITCSSADAL